MTTPRIWHTATRFADGRVLLVGGTVEVNVTELEAAIDPDDADRRDLRPGDRHVQRDRSPGAPRLGHAATLLGDGHVLVTGG